MALHYLDSSALVKLVLREPESDVLAEFLAGADLVSSELALTEVPRAVRRVIDGSGASVRERVLVTASAALAQLALVALDRTLLETAGALDAPALRALDAIHVACAVDVSPIDAFITYDDRQFAAARLAGMPAVAPGR